MNFLHVGIKLHLREWCIEPREQRDVNHASPSGKTASRLKFKKFEGPEFRAVLSFGGIWNGTAPLVVLCVEREVSCIVIKSYYAFCGAVVL
jgi:hypothetical protein